MLINVSTSHIAAAKPYFHQSPINGKAYELPEVAIVNEIKFDFIAKSGKLQGEVCDQITPFDFDLPIPQANP